MIFLEKERSLVKINKKILTMKIMSSVLNIRNETNDLLK